jgi:hypothetical protein
MTRIVLQMFLDSPTRELYGRELCLQIGAPAEPSIRCFANWSVTE